MPCGPLPTASLCGRSAAHPGLPAVQRIATALPRTGSVACRATAAAQLTPDRCTGTIERRLEAGGALLSSSSSIGTHPAPDTWLAYSWRLRSCSPGVADVAVERLRRQLGWGGRWAWELIEDAESDAEEEQEAAWQAEEAEAVLSSSSGSSSRQPIVRSSRGAGRRSSVQRHCRGRVLMGAAVYDMQRPWGSSAADALPEDLQSLRAGKLLTAEQEAWLGELVQAGRAAQLQLQHQTEESVGSSGASTPLWRLRASGPAEPLELAMRRGAAAHQLLFDANLRLITVSRSKLLGGGTFLPPQLLQELENAGRDALWRAAAGFQPGRRLRFSSYAVSAVQNKMRDVLRHQREVVMHVPKEVHPWSAGVRAAARHMLLERRQQGYDGGQPVQQQPQQVSSGQQPLQHRRQDQRPESAEQWSQQEQQPSDKPLERLAAAARLTQRQAAMGLAASRRQRLASFGCLVMAEAVEGAGGTSPHRSEQLALFGDVPQPEQQEQDEADLAGVAAREAVQLLLSHLPTSRHVEVLRLRHRLGNGDAGHIADQHELDFTSVGQQLGVSRQRAQVLYRAAVDAARQQAAALGIC